MTEDQGHTGLVRPISRVLATELSDAEIDMVAGASCTIYTQNCTRDRWGANIDCGPTTCDDNEPR